MLRNRKESWRKEIFLLGIAISFFAGALAHLRDSTDRKKELAQISLSQTRELASIPNAAERKPNLALAFNLGCLQEGTRTITTIEPHIHFQASLCKKLPQLRVFFEGDEIIYFQDTKQITTSYVSLRPGKNWVEFRWAAGSEKVQIERDQKPME